MSTRSQNRRINPQESTENVRENATSPDLAENIESREQDVVVAGPSSAESSRIKNSVMRTT